MKDYVRTVTYKAEQYIGQDLSGIQRDEVGNIFVQTPLGKMAVKEGDWLIYRGDLIWCIENEEFTRDYKETQC